jgi:D-arabinitol 2-dehydrogenase
MFSTTSEQQADTSHPGVHLKRTLASFSLEGRTAVVTGGARGLGLVMGHALINSGADLAIVDMNSS